MELCGIPPPTIDWSNSNLPEAWKKFEQHVKNMFQVSRIKVDFSFNTVDHIGFKVFQF